MNKPIFLLIPLLLVALLTACGSAVSPNTLANNDTLRLDEPTPKPAVVETVVETAISTPLPTIILPISLYIIDDADETFSSQRTEEELTAVYTRVNEIWAQANIVIKIQTIQRLELSGTPLQAVLRGDFQPFFNSLSRNEIDIQEPSLLNGFYSQSIGGSNGIVPSNTRLFFVTDTPSVHDERVTSHEIGHILGLHHVPDDPDRLLFSGTNGMTLSPEEIAVARYFAQGMLDRLR